jgi:hypothetical protein
VAANVTKMKGVVCSFIGSSDTRPTP